jgi:hypothetical protein
MIAGVSVVALAASAIPSHAADAKQSLAEQGQANAAPQSGNGATVDAGRPAPATQNSASDDRGSRESRPTARESRQTNAQSVENRWKWWRTPQVSGGDSATAENESDETSTNAANGNDARNKVTICHCPPGNPNNCHTISVGAPAVPAHLGHGDSLGACGDTSPSGP